MRNLGRRGRVAVAVGVLAVVLLGALAWGLRPRGSTPVTEDEALRDFRARAGSTARRPGDSGSGARPDPGVYRYALVGSESVKLGPLPTEDRSYPEVATAIVTHPDHGCFELAVNLIEQHTEATRYCHEDAGLRLDEHLKHQQIGALTPTATMSCDPGLVASAGSSGPTELRCSLHLTGGPAKISAKVLGTATVGDEAQLTVGGTPVEVRRVSLEYVISGALTGSWSEELWLELRTNLPVRIERALDLSGLATFRERSELQLVDLTPAR